MKKIIIILSFVFASLATFAQNFELIKTIDNKTLSVANLGKNVEIIENNEQYTKVFQKIQIAGCSPAVARRLLASGYFDLKINNGVLSKKPEKIFNVNGIDISIKIQYVIHKPKHIEVI